MRVYHIGVNRCANDRRQRHTDGGCSFLAMHGGGGPRYLATVEGGFDGAVCKTWMANPIWRVWCEMDGNKDGNFDRLRSVAVVMPLVGVIALLGSGAEVCCHLPLALSRFD